MILTLCGSSRFEKQYKAMNERLTLAGHVVFSLSVYPSDKSIREWYTEEQKNRLDLVHLAKIKASDGIVVLNVDGYIGPSTTREIEWAKMLDKKIFWLETSAHGKFLGAGIGHIPGAPF
jgi:hypothetical protein